MIDIANFNPGLHLGIDGTKAPVGSARKMKNMLISDRGGISKRPGTKLLGTYSSDVTGVRGLANYKKPYGSSEVLIKGFGTKTEYYNPDYGDWTTLESGFTSGQEWGITSHFDSSDNEGYAYMCNRTEPYRRWAGTYTQLNGALAGGETTVTVDAIEASTGDAGYYSGTAHAVTTTTIDVNDSWADDFWNTYYVKITSGASSGKIALISDTADESGTGYSTITFDTIAGLTGTPTFSIIKTQFVAASTLVIDDEEVAYSATPSSTTFTTSAIVSAHADGAPVTIKPTEYPGAPRGNVLSAYLSRMIVGNVLTGIGTDGTDAQGSPMTGAFNVSALDSGTDFTFTYAGRAAGEGDRVPVAYGGGPITDIVSQEEYFYVFKQDYIEADTYSQDASDLIDRQPLKQEVGAIGRVIKGKDDVYFVTPRNEISSIGRAASKDILPQTANIGSVIKRYLDDCVFTGHRGIEHRDRIYFAHKESSTDSYNNRVLVYNKTTKSFEGIWYVSAFGFSPWKEDLYYGDVVTPNVYKMFEGTNDVQGDDEFGITAEWLSNWMNFTPSDFDTNSVHSYAVEGYLKGETEITFEMYDDFASDPSLSFSFSGSESGFITADNFNNYLGATALGISPESALGDADENGFRHFKFVVYFPHIYGNHFSIGVKNDGKGQEFDITRIGLGAESDKLKEALNVKSI